MGRLIQLPVLQLSLILIAFWAALAPSTANAQGISLLRDAEIEEFIEDYSYPIFEAAGIPKDSIEILLVNDLSFNAFAGGRFMGVNAGLLTFAQTPNQVEAVIAHEAGHLAGNHSARTQEAIANASRPLILGLILAAGAIAAGAPEAGIGLLGLGQTVGTANFLKYSRGQESSADAASITYLNKIGHSSKGALEIWRRQRNNQIIRGRQINPYYVTHPLASTRLNALKTRAEASPYFDVVDPPEEIYRLEMIQAKIHGFLSDPESVLVRHPIEDQSDQARYARAVAYYRIARLDEALSEINYLTSQYGDNPYYHELQGQMLYESGRAKDAVAPQTKAVKLKPDSALLRISLGRSLLGTGDKPDRAKSIAEFKRALLLERSNSFAWFELARAYGADENEPMANLATAESRYYGGASRDANSFARRAIVSLRQGSSEWRQAADIILATTPKGQDPRLPKALPPGERKTKPKAPEEPKKQEVPDPT